jgi:hypothetical protein
VAIFFFVPAVAQRKTVTEMPTVTSLSKRLKERFCDWFFSRNYFSFFRLMSRLTFPFLVITRIRAVAFAAVIFLVLLAQGGMVRFGERVEHESEVGQARRVIGGDDFSGMISQG